MEDLSKNQLILLALLVSFVTSIATGIATVSLIDQAPPRVTQTIHRVVERTIETVTPDPETSAEVVTKETTVVVKEEDVITESIAAARASLVRLYADRLVPPQDGEGDAVQEEVFAGLAVVVSADGMIVTASGEVLGGAESVYGAVFPGGETASAEVEKREAIGVATLRILTDPSKGISFTPLAFAPEKNVRLGQTVLLLGGENITTVAEGIVSSLTTLPAGEGAPRLTALTATIAAPDEGAPIMNIFGELVGLANAKGSTSYIPINIIAEAL